MKKLHNIYGLREHRKELRKNPTPQEEKLWWYLRGKNLGFKFRRQHSIGGYVVDFFCKEKSLVIELDGKVHDSETAREYDKLRDEFIADFGYTILRIPNSEIDNDIDTVITKIKEKL